MSQLCDLVQELDFSIKLSWARPKSFILFIFFLKSVPRCSSEKNNDNNDKKELF